MPRATDRIILASQSPRRAELLASTGIPFDVVPSYIPEDLRPGEVLEDQLTRLAEAKARAVARLAGGRFVIAADTIVVRDGEVMGKPSDEADAARMLRKLSGGPHDVVTGYAVYDADRDRLEGGAVRTRVYFKALRPDEIAAYIATGCPSDKAGAYGIQGRAAYMVERIEGSYTNVVGLPLAEIVETLVRMGAVVP